MQAIHYRDADFDGQQLFYREAGPPGAPTVVLLHGFPASSFMFRDLIPLLGGYHVIAPDHLGFGLSAAPPAAHFGYTFDALAGLTAGLPGPARNYPVRDVCPGLRRAGGLAAGPGRPRRGHGDHHSERQRL